MGGQAPCWFPLSLTFHTSCLWSDVYFQSGLYWSAPHPLPLAAPCASCLQQITRKLLIWRKVSSACAGHTLVRAPPAASGAAKVTFDRIKASKKQKQPLCFGLKSLTTSVLVPFWRRRRFLKGFQCRSGAEFAVLSLDKKQPGFSGEYVHFWPFGLSFGSLFTPTPRVFPCSGRWFSS